MLDVILRRLETQDPDHPPTMTDVWASDLRLVPVIMRPIGALLAWAGTFTGN